MFGLPLFINGKDISPKLFILFHSFILSLKISIVKVLNRKNNYQLSIINYQLK